MIFKQKGFQRSCSKQRLRSSGIPVTRSSMDTDHSIPLTNIAVMTGYHGDIDYPKVMIYYIQAIVIRSVSICANPCIYYF